MPFEKGKSGNPGGRPRDQLRQLARARTEDAIAVLINVMRSPKSAAAARVAAATVLLDRGWGRPVQATAFVDTEGADRPLTEVTAPFDTARRIAFLLTLGLRAKDAEAEVPHE